MVNSLELLDAIREKAGLGEDQLQLGLFELSGDDFAVPMDGVRKGYELFIDYIDTIRTKICASETRSLLAADFETSGPVLVTLMAADAYLSRLQLPVLATIGALILKHGVNRLCGA